MKNIIYLLAIVLVMSSCEEREIIDSSVYDCQLTRTTRAQEHALHEDFQQQLDDLLPFMPGAQMALRTADGDTWTGTIGKADLFNDVDFQTCTKSMVGSVSKTFTGVLIMQLHEEGLLSVDDKMSEHLETELVSNITNGDKITIRQLLTHTSGIKDYLGVTHFIDALNTPNYTLTQREKLEYIYGANADFEPGEGYNYSNSNYVLLGLIVENLRGMRLWEANDQYIIQKLNLRNTKMGTEANPIPEGTARPYISTNGLNYYDIMSNSVSDAATGDGGIASNAQDLTIFIEALFEGNLVADSTLQLMITDMVETNGGTYPNWGNDSYGFGLEKYESPYGTVYGHTGSTSSYLAFLLYFEDSESTLAICLNAAAFDNAYYEKLFSTFDELMKLMFE